MNKIIEYINRNNIEECRIYIDKNVNIKNIDIVIDELLDYYDEYKSNEEYKFILETLKDLRISFLEEKLFITKSVDKEPFVKRVSDDLIINLTGESGSGKSTMCSDFDGIAAIIVDTDKVFGKKLGNDEVSQKLYNYLMKKYNRIPSLFEEFDLCYDGIIDCFRNTDKLLIIDSAQFRNMRDLSKLRGEVIVIRTCADTCYKRCIERFNKRYPNASFEEKNNYLLRKKGIIYDWYPKLNDFILQLYEL